MRHHAILPAPHLKQARLQMIGQGIDPRADIDRRVAQSWQRSHINTEAKYLMLRHAFEVWAVNRVELLTDYLNAKSRAAIARIGAQQEGVLRSHMVMRDGRIRDSVIFSIVAAEWPACQQQLAQKLRAD